MQTVTGTRKVVGIGECAVSDNPEDSLITHGLGSCLGITVYDPVAKVGGLLHAMLPFSPKGTPNPDEYTKYVDTGVPVLFKRCYELGAVKGRMILKVAGGAHVLAVLPENDLFRIGHRNFITLKKILWKNHVLIAAQDVGGNESRTLTLFMANGAVEVSQKGQVHSL